MGVARDERRALCDLFEELGPDAPTLCEGWTTRDLAAHLVVREHRIDAAPGIILPALAKHTERVQNDYAQRPWADLVSTIRTGPAWYWPTSFGALDELTNTAEFLVHHEDVRRAQPDWAPRPADTLRDKAAWASVKQSAKMYYRRSGIGVTLRTPAGQSVIAHGDGEAVSVLGEPMDLLLYSFGRSAVRLSFEGTESAIATLQDTSRGL
ncbi:TIGR03085 family metal-binding protein [Amycolatopsis sp. cg5]|uniref:TIGR03085 family metal-binding protein n=1 Tax=Amycolatopsis sp. cg5 TaxID=3238802 RepID=UPI0035238B4E